MTKEEKEAVLHCLRAMIDEELCEECPLYGTTGTDHCEKDCVRLAIKELEQEPKTGHWIERIERDDWNDYEEVWYECNQCHLVSERASNYCPNCRIKMQEVEDNG